jgi:hypothetical protein
MNKTNLCALLQVHSNLCMTFGELEEVKSSLESEMRRIVLVPFNASTRSIDSSSDNLVPFQPSYLTAIYRFDESVKKILSTNHGKKLVFFSSHDVQSKGKLAFLLGCYLMMTRRLGFEETCLALRPLWKLHDEISSVEKLVETSLRAFCCARCLNWIDFGNHPTEVETNKQIIDVEEFDHYAR